MPVFDKFKKNTPTTRPMSPRRSPGPDSAGQLVTSEAAMNLEAHLQQPVEESTILKDLITLRSHIEAHTTSFYHKDHVAVNGTELKRHLDDKIPKSAAGNATALASILLEPRSRATGIRVVIARILFACIDFCGDPQQTLLSPAAVSLVSAFRPKERSEESQEVYQLALARWRILVTFLLPALDKKASDVRARGMIDTLNIMLAPFIDEQHASGKGKEGRENNLAMIINRAARLGTMLFSQPTTWEFSWDIPADAPNENLQRKSKWSTTKRKGVVVYPAIWKTGDLDGRELPKAILKEDAEIDSSPVTISSMAMDIREDTFQSREYRLSKRDIARPKVEAVANTSGPERLHEQHQPSNASPVRKDFVELGENDLSYRNGSLRTYEQQQSNIPSRSKMDTEQELVPASTAAERTYGQKSSGTSSIARKEVARSEQTVGLDSITANDPYEQQEFNSFDLAEREEPGSLEKVISNSTAARRPFVQLQQQHAPAKERISEPQSPTSKNRIDEFTIVPTPLHMPDVGPSDISEEDPPSGEDSPSEDSPKMETKPGYNKPTPMLPQEQTYLGLTSEPPKSSTKAEYDMRVQMRTREQISKPIRGPRPQSPIEAAKAEHDPTARTQPQEPASTLDQGYRHESSKQKVKRKCGIVGRTNSQRLASGDDRGTRVESSRTKAKAEYDTIGLAQSREPTSGRGHSSGQGSPEMENSPQHAADAPSPMFEHNFTKHQGGKIRKQRQRSQNPSKKIWRSWLE